MKTLFRLLFVRPQIDSMWKLAERFVRVVYVDKSFVTIEVTSEMVGFFFLIVPMTEFLIAYEPVKITVTTHNFQKECK